MEKIPVEKRLFCLPWTQTILGTHLKGKANFMALDWVTRVNFEPAMMGICLNRQNASHAAVEEAGEFSVNVPDVDMVAITDYTGIVSGRSVDKSGLFEVFYGKLRSAPMIKRCPLAMECRLVQKVSLPTNTFFIGEIVTIYSEERFLTEGKPDTKKINPFVLTMPENCYWSIGECVGKAWDAGVDLRERMRQSEQASDIKKI